MMHKLIIATMVALLVAGARAEDFSVKNGADAALQSRVFDNREPVELFPACIAILLDINFQISEADFSSGLIVADRGGDFYSNYHGRKHVITVHLSKVPERSNSTRVRLSAIHPGGPGPDYSQFYQDFFAHLDRELFREQ